MLRTCQNSLEVMSLKPLGSPLMAVKKGGVEMLAGEAD